MREKLAVFLNDLNRLTPLAIVCLASGVCVPSFLEFFSGRLAMGSMLGRFCVAFALATVGVRLVTRVLWHYAIKNAVDEAAAERAKGPPGPGSRTEATRIAK